MKKMFRLLENVKDSNSFREVTSFEHVNGTQQDLYIRLIQKMADSQPGECPLRWLPSSGATINFKFDSLDQANVIERAGVMVYPTDDRSVWKVTLLATDKISGNVTVTLTDGGQTETLLLDGRLIVSSTDSDRFFC